MKNVNQYLFPLSSNIQGGVNVDYRLDGEINCKRVVS